MKQIETSLGELQKWLRTNDYKGYEYYDGLDSWLRIFTGENWFAKRLLIQFFKRFPYNLRPFLGVKPKVSTKGMGFISRGCIRLWRAYGDVENKQMAESHLKWLSENCSEGYAGACWGNHFDHASGSFELPRFMPTVVWSGFIAHAFLDAYEVFEKERYLQTAKSVCDFIMKDLPVTDFNDSHCISYVPFDKLLVHNANMIAASLLARTYSFTSEKPLFDYSKKAMKFSCDSQLENGAWHYAVNSKWVDNWHTAYNLDSLKCYIESTGDKTFEENLKRGYQFYKENFFYDDGKPKYYFNRLRWVDIQAAAQSIDTLCYFSDMDPEALDLARKVANWTIANMQDESGYFYYRDLGWKRVKAPFIHWGQATMHCALSHLLLKLNASKPESKSKLTAILCES